MKFCLDSNVALKWVLNESDSTLAIRLRDDFGLGVHELIVPDIFPVEIAHGLARAERRGIIPVGDGTQKLADIFSFMPDLISYLPIPPRAFTIASSARHGVYDCLYIALAENEGCDLVTADDALVKKFHSQFPFIVSLSSLP
jgi:predicted nucleic acid-binding protein